MSIKTIKPEVLFNTQKRNLFGKTNIANKCAKTANI